MTPLVYLHGFASGRSSSKARFFREYLEARGVTVTVPDLAAGDFEHLTITGQLQVIGQAAGGGPISIMGSSMGGYLAALYAARHPEVQRVVLLAPGFAFARRWPEYLGTQKFQAWREAGSMEVFHYGEDRNRQLSYGLQIDAERYEEFPDVRQPVLVFHGRHDDVVPPAASQEFASTRPNVRLEILDSGHDLLNVLDYMAPRVFDFLAA
jgi:pimeloyl-ACP methyl ester carboxylesterase